MDDNAKTAIALVQKWVSERDAATPEWLKHRNQQFVERAGISASQAIRLILDVEHGDIPITVFHQTVDAIVDEQYRSHNHPAPLD